MNFTKHCPFFFSRAKTGLVVGMLLTLLAGPAGAQVAEAPAPTPFLNATVTPPPEFTAFLDREEKLADDLAARSGFTLSPGFREFFRLARAGQLAAARAAFAVAAQNASGTNANPEVKSPVAQVACDAELGVEAFGQADPDWVMATAREMTNELTAGSIYFGGTDPGRGLPTMLCPAPGDPFYVVSQNPLADGRYLDLLRAEYGGRIWLPGSNEVRQCYIAYSADEEARRQKHQLLPGEEVHQENGQSVIQGQVAVMKVNALIAKIVFDHNPDRNFFVEESYPLEWMYPNLQPAGLLLKLNREPVKELTAAVIAQDGAFWNGQLAGKLGGWYDRSLSVTDLCGRVEQAFGRAARAGFPHAGLAADEAERAWVAKFRTAIAGVYAWRVSPQCPAEYQPPGGMERQAVLTAAEQAYRQAFALYPAGPETVYGFVNLLAQENRLAEAIRVAQAGLACQPATATDTTRQLQQLVVQLDTYQTKLAERAAAATKQLAVLEASHAEHPDDFRGTLALVNARVTAGQTNQGFALLDELAGRPGLTAGELEGVAHYLGYYDRLDRLEPVLARITVLQPDSPENWYDYAALKAVRGDRMAAIAGLAKALDLAAARRQTNSTAHDLTTVAAQDARLDSIRNDPAIQSRLGPAKP